MQTWPGVVSKCRQMDYQFRYSEGEKERPQIKKAKPKIRIPQQVNSPTYS